jgi:hypothetical protein
MKENPSVAQKYGSGCRFDRNGWVYLHIEGGASERGHQHGFLLKPELERIFRSLRYLTYWNTGKKWEFFVEAALSLMSDHLPEELLSEMIGIADGARQAGLDIGWEDILTWNAYEELTDYWWPNKATELKYAPVYPCRRDHCSAFLAHGPATSDGRIVMAHNSWDNFETGQFSNLILDIQPSQGNRMFMQSAPGWIDSFADFFVTSAGIMGTETTMGGFSLYKEGEVPEFVRVREAMQYGTTLDEFVEFMRKRNNGGYANAWLLADINRKVIMRFELGLEFSNVEVNPEKESPGAGPGYFIGFNAPLDPRIRNLECSNTGYGDIRRHQGARQVRLKELVGREQYGQITSDVAKKILADHIDIYRQQRNSHEPWVNPCSRTVDGHYELDPREYMSDPSRPLPFQPRGAVDGKTMDSEQARKMSFDARWGNSSGLPFDATKFLAKHLQWSHLDGYLLDRPSQEWTTFNAP